MASPDLGKMVGPLPLGAWVAVVAGGLGFMVYSRKQAAVVPAASNVMTPEDGSGINGVGDGTVGGWTPTTPVAQDPGGTVAKPTTNDEWGAAAIRFLIAHNYDPNVADSAIRKYLDEETGFSASEYAMVGVAIAGIGPTPQILPAPVFGKPAGPVVAGKSSWRNPPRGTTYVRADGGHGAIYQVWPDGSRHYVSAFQYAALGRPRVTPYGSAPVSHATHPSTPTGVKTAKDRHYVVRPGDNLSKIASKFYNNPREYVRIYNANKGVIHNPNVIRPGMVLVIP